MKKFNLRCYGIWMHEGKVLTSSESYKGFEFNKFPGGGVIWGEGLKNTLKREFKEELSLDIEVGDLLYLNTHFLPSKFDEKDQLQIFYFKVIPTNAPEWMLAKSEFVANEDDITFRWLSVDEDLISHFSLPLDIELCKKLTKD